MMRLYLCTCFLFVVFFSLKANSLSIVSKVSDLPVTADGMHVVEGTNALEFWTWHTKRSFSYQYNFALADRASQLRFNQGYGVGLGRRSEFGLTFHSAWTKGSKETVGLNEKDYALKGMKKDGFATGDITPYLLYSVIKTDNKGVGLLLGVKMGIPTGDNDKLSGEGGLTVEPWISFAIQILGSRLVANLAYLVRPEKVVHTENLVFEQDDDFIWRIGVRVPRKNDAAWSIEMEGAVGFMTYEGGRPSSASRPMRIVGGIDFPAGKRSRISLFASVAIAGETFPTYMMSIGHKSKPMNDDEDGDGIRGRADKCPLLKEDFDGFEDDDGCPDLDNDKDGFPDDEDHCPLIQASTFSDDGC